MTSPNELRACAQPRALPYSAARIQVATRDPPFTDLLHIAHTPACSVTVHVHIKY